jgi:hypothetical protein
MPKAALVALTCKLARAAMVVPAVNGGNLAGPGKTSSSRRLNEHRAFSGSETLREYESSPGKLRVFCSKCGSPIYAYLTSTPDVIRIRLGSLDTPFSKQPRAHTFVSEKAHWEPLSDGLPQLPEWAPKSVLVQRGSRQG